MAGASGPRANSRVAAVGAVMAAIVARYALDSAVGRLTSITVFGEYAVVMAFALMAAGIAPMGLPEVGNRVIPGFGREGDHVAIRRYVRFSGTVTVLAGASLGLLIIGGQILGVVPLSRGAALSLGVLIPCMALLTTRRSLTLATVGGNVALFAQSFAIAAAAVVVGVQGLVNGLSIAVITVTVSATSVLVAVYVCRPRPSVPSTDRTTEGTARVLPFGSWLRSGSAVVFSTFATLVIGQVDVILVHHYASAEETGAYAAASRLALVATLALGGLIPREAPILGRYVTQGRYEQALREFRRAGGLSGGVALACAVGFVLLGRPVLEAYVPGSGDAYKWLLILAVGRCVTAFVGPAAEFLIVLGAQRWAALSSWLGLGLAAVGIAVLGPRYGASGVAVATTVGTCTRASMQYFAATRRLRSLMSAQQRNVLDEGP